VKHREKLEPPIFPGAGVCRPVDRKEVKANPAAEKAIQQEWDRLRARRAWDEENPREWKVVAKEAREEDRGPFWHDLRLRRGEKH
jgi:hypothetical protein